MLKKIFIYLFFGFFLSIFTLIFILAISIFYCASPALSSKKLPRAEIFSFENTTPQNTLQNISARLTNHLTLVTYNIGYASGNKNNLGAILSRDEIIKNLNNMAAELKKLNPDIIALQEVDISATRSHDIDEMRFLANALGMPYGARVITWNKNYLPWPYWPVSLQFGKIISGQAILSRYPILKQQVYVQDKPAANAFWYNWFYLDRVFQRVMINFNGEKISLWNVHLEAFDEKTKITQAEKLAELVQTKNTPFKTPLKFVAEFVLGDFNSASFMNEKFAQNLKNNNEDGPAALKIFIQKSNLSNAETSEPSLTFPSWEPDRKIDHIFFGNFSEKNVQFIKMGTLPLTASDHLPVFAEFIYK